MYPYAKQFRVGGFQERRRAHPIRLRPCRSGRALLSDTEIGEIWRAAGDAASPYGTIIRLLILTG